MHSKNIISGVFTLRHVFCIWMRKKIEPFYFFVSFHTNSAITQVAQLQDTKYLGERSQRNNKVLNFFAHPNTKYMSLSHSVGTQLKLHYV